MQTMLHGRRVGYAEAGRGRPLVLVHGYPLNRTMWEPQLNGLVEVAHMIAPDLWGLGESAPVSDTNMGTYADEVRELLDEQGVTEPAILCGLSMGGYIVFEYFRRYPDRVAGVILANTKASPDSAEGKAGRDQSAATAQEQGAGAIAAAMLPKLLSPKAYQTRPQLVERVAHIMTSATVEGLVAALRAMRDRPDSTLTLAEITQPALVIGGADDQLFPQSEFENMARALRNGRLVILPGAGHLSNLEQPDLFNRALREFIRGLS
jgi:pimeloyl-ACP methyl ester carboxylesterase